MAAPLVSVVVRAFKLNEWIFEAVDSVIKQTYRGPVEVVVCYDKASNTPHILDKLRELASQTPANRAVRVVEHEPMGPAHAFFECGIRQSRGDYVMFLDYDNVMPSDYVERVLSHAEGDKCLCTSPMKMDKEGRLLNTRVARVPKKILVEELAWGNFCDTNRGCQYLDFTLKSLKGQVIKPYEVILVLKDCEIRHIEAVTQGLNHVVIEQRRGFFTHALNLGKREAQGDIIIFTDDDVILPKGWVKRYLKLHALYRDIAGIGSRDIYLDLNNVKLSPTPGDKPWVRLFRWTIRPVMDEPHPLLSKYKLGVYITKKFRIAYGPCIPYRTCYSLPLRGANMS